MRSFKSFVYCTALALMATVAHAGVMHPIPSHPITIDTGKSSRTLLERGLRA